MQQTNNNSFIKLITPIFIVFIFINCLVLGFKEKMLSIHIDAKVVFGSNCILFFISTLCIALHSKAIASKNPNALVRSIMLSTTLKFLIVAISTMLYAKFSGNNKSVYGIYCGLFLYIIYTYLEVRIALKLNKKNGS